MLRCKPHNLTVSANSLQFFKFVNIFGFHKSSLSTFLPPKLLDSIWNVSPPPLCTKKINPHARFPSKSTTIACSFNQTGAKHDDGIELLHSIVLPYSPVLKRPRLERTVSVAIMGTPNGIELIYITCYHGFVSVCILQWFIYFLNSIDTAFNCGNISDVKSTYN